MPKYEVTVYESVLHSIEIEAENEAEASEKGFRLIMTQPHYTESLGMEEIIEVEAVN
jgi:hypothetical protein